MDRSLRTILSNEALLGYGLNNETNQSIGSVLCRLAGQVRHCTVQYVAGAGLGGTCCGGSGQCDLSASGGSAWKSSSASCVDSIILPFAFRMINGFVVGCLFTTGRSIVQKVPVVPLSIIRFVLVGGPEEHVLQ